MVAMSSRTSTRRPWAGRRGAAASPIVEELELLGHLVEKDSATRSRLSNRRLKLRCVCVSCVQKKAKKAKRDTFTVQVYTGGSRVLAYSTVIQSYTVYCVCCVLARHPTTPTYYVNKLVWPDGRWPMARNAWIPGRP